MTTSTIVPRPGWFTKRRLAWATGAGLVGCGMACALPGILIAAVGGGAGASVAAHLQSAGGELTAGLSVFGITVVSLVALGGWKRRRMKAMASESGCGCSGSEAIYRSPETAKDAPVVCTADLVDKVSIDAQLDGYREAFRHLVRTVRASPNEIAWVFRSTPGLPDKLRTLASNEHACCSFFTFDVSTSASGDEIVWTVKAPDAAREVLEAFCELPMRLGSGAATSEIKEHVTKAGLVFAADGPR